MTYAEQAAAYRSRHAIIPNDPDENGIVRCFTDKLPVYTLRNGSLRHDTSGLTPTVAYTADPACKARTWHHYGQTCVTCGGVA